MLTQDGLIASYVLLAATLLMLNLRSRWSWRIKLIAIIIVSAAYFAYYFSLPAMLGWPTDEHVPKKFKLVSVLVQEPAYADDPDARIYFWAVDLANPRETRPRAYELPYSPPLQAQFEGARGKLRKSIPQIGEVEDPDAIKGEPKDFSQLGQKSLKIEFKDAPIGGAPVKDAPR